MKTQSLDGDAPSYDHEHLLKTIEMLQDQLHVAHDENSKMKEINKRLLN